MRRVLTLAFTAAAILVVFAQPAFAAIMNMR